METVPVRGYGYKGMKFLPNSQIFASFFSAPPRRLKRSKGIEAATFVSELAKRVTKSAKSFQNQQKFAFCCLKVRLFKKIHLSLQKITLIIYNIV